MDKPQNGIIVDIHNTLFNNKNKVNDNLLIILNELSKVFYICLITAHYYENIETLKKQLSNNKIKYIIKRENQ